MFFMLLIQWQKPMALSTRIGIFVVELPLRVISSLTKTFPLSSYSVSEMPLQNETVVVFDTKSAM
jgi:hypothetical protein